MPHTRTLMLPVSSTRKLRAAKSRCCNGCRLFVVVVVQTNKIANEKRLHCSNNLCSVEKKKKKKKKTYDDLVGVQVPNALGCFEHNVDLFVHEFRSFQ
jgi:hypothetical protein